MPLTTLAASRTFYSTTATPHAMRSKPQGINVLAVNEVLVQRLNQSEPGQLGKLTRSMADAGVNIEVLYSDHDHQLILVVDDFDKGRKVSEAWEKR
jgi:hypothetical protein